MINNLVCGFNNQEYGDMSGYDQMIIYNSQLGQEFSSHPTISHNIMYPLVMSK